MAVFLSFLFVLTFCLLTDTTELLGLSVEDTLLVDSEGISISTILEETIDDFFNLGGLGSGILSISSSLIGVIDTEAKELVDDLSLECVLDFVAEDLTRSTSDFSLKKLCVSSAKSGGDLFFTIGLMTLSY